MTRAAPFTKVLVANRAEVALRIIRALHDLGIAAAAVHAADDAAPLHADEAVALAGQGPAAYLDIPALIDAARRTGAQAVHPGYGFLSERADFAQACADAGLTFIGATPAQLALFGDKARARELARRCAVPVLAGTGGAIGLQEAAAFFASHASTGVMLKAVAGGGGRGMRAVRAAADLPAAFERCRAEARAAFGVDGVYAERLMPRARHIEVQVAGDGRHMVSLGERDCTLQRRFQKLVEMAPSPVLDDAMRERLADAALRLSREVGYLGLGTFEFLVDLAAGDFVFIEANPRLQVEHTVTEEVTGLDLVQLQIHLAAGRTLAELGLADAPRPQGVAIQWRLNAEALDARGQAVPSSGRLDRFDMAQGPGVRVDTHGVAGSTPSPHYDSLLAKLVVRGARVEDAMRRSQRALAECRIDGLATNLALLRVLATRPELLTAELHTGWLEAHLPELLPPCAAPEAADPHAVVATMPGRLLQFSVAVGDAVAAGAELAVVEAMKMEHVLTAPRAGRIAALDVAAGSIVEPGQRLLVLMPDDGRAEATAASAPAADPGHIRPDLQRVIARTAFTLDAARPDAIARRHAQGGRTARENIADLCDEGSFIEYGALAVAAQSRRRTAEDLIANTPADGLVTGIGAVNGAQFGSERSRTVVMAYDATVLAGTQGARNHAKTDRMLHIAAEQALPVVLFAEGGGGRPGDTDVPVVAGLNVPTFASYAALSGRVPVVGIAAGRCFAGNAALLGCSDVVIATRRSNIGMGGPAMVEGGGLGVFTPEQIGPAAVQQANGVIDVLVDDEAQAVVAAKHYLSFFQGHTRDVTAPDTRRLRSVVPENRLRVYDSRAVLPALFDEGSALFLRTGFGAGIHTALARLDGRPVGVLASNPGHLGGAIDADAADKAARFMQLCNAHGLPLVSLIDTPGFMVGPDTEATAQVRHASRLFVTAGALRVPFFAVVLRKGYGLGAMAMAAGGLHRPVFTVAWPTGEFGAMGLEGAVRLGFRKELAEQPAGPGREALYQQLVAQQYANGQAIHLAATLEIDAVIDPADTRAWLARGLASAQVRPLTARFVDTW